MQTIEPYDPMPAPANCWHVPNVEYVTCKEIHTTREAREAKKRRNAADVRCEAEVEAKKALGERRKRDA
jgi:hypothetical protein